MMKALLSIGLLGLLVIACGSGDAPTSMDANAGRSKGAQIFAIVFATGLRQSRIVLETATGVSSYADYARVIDAYEAAPDGEYACSNPKSKLFTPFSYTRTECDYQSRNCC